MGAAEVVEIPHSGKSSNQVQTYINRVPGEYRSLFDRIHGLILSMCPDVEVVLSYNMPTYKIGKDRLYVGVWRHGFTSTNVVYASGPGELTLS